MMMKNKREKEQKNHKMTSFKNYWYFDEEKNKKTESDMNIEDSDESTF